MNQRAAFLVGSLPFADEATCMQRALDQLGPDLFALPDGEIGDKSEAFPRGNRIAWVIYAVERLTADTASWQIVKPPVRGADGMATSYAGIQKLKPRRSPKAMADHVSFGYDHYFRQSYPLFTQLRQERGYAQLKFQLGVPTGFALGFAFHSQIDWLRYTNAFNTVIARDVNQARQVAGDDLIVQLEVPPELYAAYMLPAPLMGLALRPIHDLLGKITPGTQIGIHLCLGDFHNEALVHPKTLHKMVAFSNRLVDSWPSNQTLAYIHYPLAEGAVPPPTQASYYQPLQGIRLPKVARFIAGFVHEKLSLAENRTIRDAIETARGGPVDIASSCGLGRRTEAEADAVLGLMSELVRA